MCDVTYQRQRAMPTHTMSKNTDPRPINLWEGRKDRFGQFGRDVTVHVIPLGPRFLRCVDVETGAGAEVVGVVFALDVEATWSEKGSDRSVQVVRLVV